MQNVLHSLLRGQLSTLFPAISACASLNGSWIISLKHYMHLIRSRPVRQITILFCTASNANIIRRGRSLMISSLTALNISTRPETAQASHVPFRRQLQMGCMWRISSFLKPCDRNQNYYNNPTCKTGGVIFIYNRFCSNHRSAAFLI